MAYKNCKSCNNEVSDTVTGNLMLNDGNFYCLDCIVNFANKQVR